MVNAKKLELIKELKALRKEKGMTQKELADQLGLTDKAISKWERDLSCPDINTLPKLAEILDTSVETLLNTSRKPTESHRGANYLIDLILKAVPAAMGIAVIVTAILDEIDLRSALIMLGIGISCLSIYLLKQNKNQ